jgi:hypothetical protein
MGVLSCFLTRRRLGALLDRELPRSQRDRASAHVAGCRRCLQEVRDLERLRQAAGQAVAVAPPTDWSGFWPGIVRGIEDRRHVRVLRSWVPGRRPALALGGAAGGMLVAGVALWQLSGAPDPGAAVIVRSADTEMPGTSLVVYSPPERDVAVVWVLGPDESDQ